MFWSVLILKLVAAAFLGSHYLTDLFSPFVTYFVKSGFANPWEAFYQEGHWRAFPYTGLMLFLVSVPSALVHWVAPHVLTESLQLFLIRLPLLGADFLIYWVLTRWFIQYRHRVLWLYWCSPVTFYIAYVHGQLDAIPTAFLLLSLYLLFRKNIFLSGIVFGCAVATKLHVLIVVPFVVVYFLKNIVKDPLAVKKLGLMLLGMALSSGIIIIPLLSSEAFRVMVLATPESQRLFEFYIRVGDQLKIYLAPAFLLILFLRFATAPKVNRELFVLFVGLAFGGLVLFVPPPPGWFFWVVPFCCYICIREESISTIHLWAFNGFYLLYFLGFWSGTPEQSLQLASWFQGTLIGDDVESIALTAMQGSLGILLYLMYRAGVMGNQEYRIREIPILVGIGGDSATGKNTLSQIFQGILGKHNVTETNGDDYHRWSRGDKAWEHFTHLNPQANYLHQTVQHLEELKSGKVITKPVYDHKTGTFTKVEKVKPRRFTFFVGLHTFYVKRMRDLLELKVYMEPDERLRMMWKTDRDQNERGYTREKVLKMIESRRGDSKSYINPQRRYADWVISYCPEGGPIGDWEGKRKPNIFARHIVRNDLPLESLVNYLEKVPSLDVSWSFHSDLESQVLEVHGEIYPEQTAIIAKKCFANLEELSGSVTPHWESGINGITQLIFLSFLQVTYQKRQFEAKLLSL